MRRDDDLYFILNPALGIIKIGIAGDVESRRAQLECGAGVPLTVLRVVERGASYEKKLHFAFGPSRLLGEWFSPTPELLKLVQGRETLSDFVQRKAADISAWEQEAAQRATDRKVQQAAVTRAEREEAARLAAEEKRIRAAKKATRAAGLAKAAQKRAELADIERQRVERERSEWAAKHPSLKPRVMDPNAVALADERRALTQRLRNAAFVGVEPLPLHTNPDRGN